MAQVTAAALTSECKVLAHPASVDSIPTDGGKEDVVPMAMAAAWKLRRIVHNVRHVLAIELMCAAQGLDYRQPLKAGAGVAKGHALVRTLVEPLTEDRALSPDIVRLAAAVEAGSIRLDREHSLRGRPGIDVRRPGSVQPPASNVQRRRHTSTHAPSSDALDVSSRNPAHAAAHVGSRRPAGHRSGAAAGSRKPRCG